MSRLQRQQAHGWFSWRSYLRVPVPRRPVIDPRSGAMISMLAGAAGSGGIFTNGLASTDGQWSTTVYHATNKTPTRPITLAVPNNGTRTVKIRFKPGWTPTFDSDHHMVVINDVTGVYVEFQGLDLATSTALSAATGNVYTGSGTNTPANHVSGLPLLAGLITPRDIQRGWINHALRAGVPVTAPDHRFPATVSDGTHPGGLPMGAHLWLPRSVSLAGLSGAAKIVARAMQEYGLYVGDTSDSFGIYAEATTDGARYPFDSLTLPGSLIAQLQVIQAPR